MKTLSLLAFAALLEGCAETQPLLLSGAAVACRFARTPAEQLACQDVKRRNEAAKSAAEAQEAAAAIGVVPVAPGAIVAAPASP